LAVLLLYEGYHATPAAANIRNFRGSERGAQFRWRVAAGGQRNRRRFGSPQPGKYTRFALARRWHSAFSS
jgi:hypothetical protein